MNDKQKITIRIADLAPIPLKIAREEEECVRIAEHNVNQLWAAWSEKFRDKRSPEILAMVAFQYAKLYYNLIALESEENEILEKFEKSLDEILLKAN